MIKTFFRDSILYTFSSLSYGISFLMIPLYTHVLSPSDLGVLDLLTIFGSLVTLTVALEISQGVARFYNEEPTEADKKILASTALWFTIFMYGMFFLIAFTLSSHLSHLILRDSSYTQIFQLSLINICLTGIFNLMIGQLRWELRSIIFSSVILIHSLTTVVVSFYFTFYLKLGMSGFIIGMIIGYLIGIFFAFNYLKDTYIFNINPKKLKKMLSFSIILVPSSVTIFISLYMDRLMLNYFKSLDDVGLYGVGFRIASMSAFAIIGFQVALIPLIYKFYQKPETPQQLELIFRLFLAIAVIIVLGMALFSEMIVMLLSTPQYYVASQVVVFLVPAFLLSKMYIFAPGMSIEKKISIIFGINVFGAVLNFLFNLIFIPAFGFIGAGIATLIANAWTFGIYMFWSQKFYYVPHDWKKVCYLIVMMIILVSIGLSISLLLPYEIIINSMLIFLMVLFLFKLKFIKISEILSIIKYHE